jgi:hypothetical protein
MSQTEHNVLHGHHGEHIKSDFIQRYTAVYWLKILLVCFFIQALPNPVGFTDQIREQRQLARVGPESVAH